MSCWKPGLEKLVVATCTHTAHKEPANVACQAEFAGCLSEVKGERPISTKVRFPAGERAAHG